jgi:hypothetical protein
MRGAALAAGDASVRTTRKPMAADRYVKSEE